ncbi:hypothetical protein GKQ38_01510 [Candidatus Nanohaloarchaea archaeon]|nr:hypothetical protein GKQ38_01510 [Candidatus Nanohaloarchaea archaeon]
MYKKLLLALLFFTFFLTQANAVSWDWTPATSDPAEGDDYENGVENFEYGDTVRNAFRGSIGKEFVLSCNDGVGYSGSCPAKDLTLNICGKSINLNHKGTTEGNPGEHVWGMSTHRVYGSENYGGNIPCYLGSHSITITNDGSPVGIPDDEDDFNVVPEDMPPNRGKYLIMAMDQAGSTAEGSSLDNIHGFFLSNDPSWKSFSLSKTDVVAAEMDAGCPDMLKVQSKAVGTVIPMEDGFKMRRAVKMDTINYHTSWTCTDAQMDAWELLDSPLNKNLGRKFGVKERLYPGSISPVWDRNSEGYYPDGEIIKAKTTSGQGPFWFICRGSMDGQRVNVDGQTYRCDVKGNGVDWRGNEPKTWIIPDDGPTCQSPVVGLKPDGTKAVFWDVNEDAAPTDARTGCNYTNIDTTIETGQPDLFLCSKSDGPRETSATGGDTLTTGEENYCQFNMDSTGSLSLGDYHNGSALAVRYFVPKEAIPVGEEGSEYATTSGFKNTRYDHIHRAELDAIPCNYEDYNYYPCRTAHNQSKYQGINVSTGTAYNNSFTNLDEDAVRNMWKVSNATGQYTSDIDGIDSSRLNQIDVGRNNSEVFNGGFYPKCLGGQQWTYTPTQETVSGWECSGALDFKIPVYSFDTSQFYGETTTGFWIKPYVFREVTADPQFTSYRQARLDEDKSAATLEQIRSVCWEGTASEKPSEFNSSNSGDWFAKEVTGIGTSPSVPVPVVGNFSASSSSVGDYTCKFEFINSNGNPVRVQGNLVAISHEAAAKQHRSLAILTGEYSTWINPDWFAESTICGGSCSLLIEKEDLNGTVPQSQVRRLTSQWKDNLGYSYSSFTPNGYLAQ